MLTIFYTSCGTCISYSYQLRWVRCDVGLSRRLQDRFRFVVPTYFFSYISTLRTTYVCIKLRNYLLLNAKHLYLFLCLALKQAVVTRVLPTGFCGHHHLDYRLYLITHWLNLYQLHWRCMYISFLSQVWNRQNLLEFLE